MIDWGSVYAGKSSAPTPAGRVKPVSGGINWGAVYKQPQSGVTPMPSPAEMKTINSFKTLDANTRASMLGVYQRQAQRGDKASAAKLNLLKDHLNSDIPQTPDFVDHSISSKLYRAIDGTSKAVGNWGINSAPVLSQAFKFGKAQDPSANTKNIGKATLNFTRGIGATGAKTAYDWSPAGAVDRTLHTAQSSITGKDTKTLSGDTVQSAQKRFNEAGPIMGSKIAGKALAVAGIAGDAAYGAGGILKTVKVADKAMGNTIAKGAAPGRVGQLNQAIVKGNAQQAASDAAFGRGMAKLDAAQAQVLE